MRPFLVLSTKEHESISLNSFAALDLMDWASTRLSTSVLLYRARQDPVPTLVRSDGYAVIVGEAFASIGRPPPLQSLEATLGLNATAAAATLAERLWGRYVLVLLGTSGALEGVFRDPSGALGCCTWRCPQGLVATSTPGALLPFFRPAQLGIDWDIIAAQLADPAALTEGSSLIGVRSLAPGGFRNLVTGIDDQIWRPAAFARRPLVDPDLASMMVEQTVDHVVTNLAGDRAVAAEVSGGLDSALVATALRKGGAHTVGFIHLAPSEIDANEEQYGQAVADHLGSPLMVAHLMDLDLRLPKIAALQNEIVPSVSSFDPPAETSVIDLCRRCRADILFTGMGGDGVFWAAPTASILVDRLARDGVLAAFDPEAQRLARWTRASMLRSIWISVAAPRRQPAPMYRAPPWLEYSIARPAHPWTIDLSGIPPTKQLQITALALMQASLGVTARGMEIDVIHPLLAQPVLEACFSIPIDLLVLGGRDRGLARMAFKDRLPELVLHRRSKGDTTQRIAKSLAKGIETLRALLLDGRLVQSRLLNPERLSDILTEDNLARGADLLAIYRAAAIELGVRGWEARLSTGPGGV
jgi:asparagine synthase (glutamine-hydrolysing)